MSSPYFNMLCYSNEAGCLNYVNGFTSKFISLFLFSFHLFSATPFFYKKSIFDPRPESCLSFSQKLPQKLFSNCLVDGLLTSIV